MYGGANTADAFADLDHLVVVPDVSKPFKSAMDISECGYGFLDDFIFKDELQMKRFRKDRMLRSEG